MPTRHVLPGVSLGRISLPSIEGPVHFEPFGALFVSDEDGEFAVENPIRDTFKTTFAARLIMGFHQKGRDERKTKTELERAYKRRFQEAMQLVRDVRKEQTGSAAASFVAQEGLFTHATGEIVQEKGVQIIIINFGQGERVFAKQIEALADALREYFHQESILVEIQKNGRTLRSHDVRA